jgi:plastocyanin
MRRLALPFLALIALAALAACGGTAATNAPATASAGPPEVASQPAASAAAACAPAEAPADADVTVDIKDFAFSPEPVVAKVGDVIAWTNSDSAPHTASLMDGSCTTDQLATGITGALVFSVPGTYKYQCNVHPSQMKDYTITVE